jgi:hypothetical protein
MPLIKYRLRKLDLVKSSVIKIIQGFLMATTVTPLPREKEEKKTGCELV